MKIKVSLIAFISLVISLISFINGSKYLFDSDPLKKAVGIIALLVFLLSSFVFYYSRKYAE